MKVDIRLGNCIELMKTINDSSIDVKITSPPYDELRTYEGTLNISRLHCEEIIDGLYRITKPGGVVVWIVSDQTKNGSETGTSFEQALYALNSGFNLHDTMIYMKDGITFPDKNRYQNCFEYMFVFSKGKPRTINLITDRKNKSYGRVVSGTYRKGDGTTVKKHGIGKKINKYGIRWNIWQINSTKGNQKTGHPAMFPESIAEGHILTWSNPDDVVFDPMMGSGTTGVAAIKINRQFIGFEIVEKYFEIAKSRINDV